MLVFAPGLIGAEEVRPAAQAAADQARTAAVSDALASLVTQVVEQASAQPFKQHFDFQSLPVKKLQYIVKQLKSKVDSPPPPTHTTDIPPSALRAQR